MEEEEASPAVQHESQGLGDYAAEVGHCALFKTLPRRLWRLHALARREAYLDTSTVQKGGGGTAGLRTLMYV
jgi:hypothetical protein